MKRDLIARYLARYGEPTARWAGSVRGSWSCALVVPVRREAPEFLAGLARAVRTADAVIIVVLNETIGELPAPEHEVLRTALGREASTAIDGGWQTSWQGASVIVVDATHRGRPLPVGHGVGLARKLGADLAVALHDAGIVSSAWIHFADADVALTADRLTTPVTTAAAAAVYPFWHAPAGDAELDCATALYEVYLRFHVLGLRFAHSPYAHQTVGSAMSVRGDAYAAVRGVPKRTAAEDFYLLTKLAKLGPVAAMATSPVQIRSRRSTRVPFGTGPAVARIIERMREGRPFLLPDPRVYAVLRERLRRSIDPALDPLVLCETAERALAAATEAGGINHGLGAARKSARTSVARLARAHEWFDGLRTLQFLRRLAMHGLPHREWSTALADAPFLPAVAAERDPRQACARLAALELTSRRASGLGSALGHLREPAA